ncbi:MAG: IclR family transcriptional regulator [Sphingopyxis sp.]|uniref:IclR family transcriptional regulator n=1 Tax=Sphingopyxis sp. TaxID=1908224 RepID=UPI002ABB46AF|nr:IclR family transcriptional regulator [Sphingopyxis sp.]MDZ3832851.1 IclR family transcriptional regulator [Sphingopyxis sp.]
MDTRDVRRRAPQATSAKIEAVATASAIIDFLAESEQPVGVQHTAATLGMTKSRASRHLANLESLGLVMRNPSGRGFQLGWRVMRWGQIASARLDFAKTLEEPLQQLGARINRTVLLCAPAGGDAIVVNCIPAQSAIRIDVKIGLVLSLPHSPTARVCYAFQQREQRQAQLAELQAREPDFRVENEAQFMRQVADIQRNYYCWDRDKYGLGYAAIAAPVFNQNAELVAAIAIMLPTSELDTSLGEHTRELLLSAEKCSRLLRSRMKYPIPPAR